MMLAAAALMPRSTPKIYATLNPADKAAAMTLSNGNLTVFPTTGASYKSVRATQGKSSGKWYWEAKLDGVAVNPWMYLGIATSASSLTANPSGYNPAVTDMPGGSTYKNAVVSASHATQQIANMVLGFALDLDAKTLSLYGNGANYANISLITAGTYFPFVGFYSTQSSGSQVTVNFGATPFFMAVPTGYNAGWYL